MKNEKKQNQKWTIILFYGLYFRKLPKECINFKEMAKLQKSIEKRKALLKATLSLINNGGILEASMAKVAKMAQVSPATIYLYFENKEDMVNTLYRELKQNFSDLAFADFSQEQAVKRSFEQIWMNMARYKLQNKEEASFLAQCDNTPLINEESRQMGIASMQILFDLWERGQKEGIIKEMSHYLIYGFAMYPMSFLVSIHNRGLHEIDETSLQQAFQAAWDAIKV